MNNKKCYCVYKHTSPSGKCYIGITSMNPPEKRWGKSGQKYKQHQYFYNAIQKYGWDNFQHEILFEGLTKEEAEQKEIELIAYYKSAEHTYGYNISLGGSSVGKHSEETKIKLSIAATGRRHTEEEIRRQSEKQKGHKVSEETKRKISEAQKGKRKNFTEEGLKRLSDFNKGRPCAPKALEKTRKPVICVETQIVYESLIDAERKTGIDRKNIGKVCNNAKYWKTAGGYHWCFLNDYNKDIYIIYTPKIDRKPKSVICIETKIVYDSMKDAERKTGVFATSIGNVCKNNGKQSTAGGYHWMYYDEYLKTNKGVTA